MGLRRLFRRSKNKYSAPSIAASAPDLNPYAPYEGSSNSSAHTPFASYSIPSQSSSRTYSYNEPSRLGPSNTTPYDRSPAYPYGAPTNLFQHPAQRLCRECSFPLSCLRVRTDRKGHLGRLYFRCDRCGDFRGWADDWGVYEQNPQCRCGQFSRLNRAGPNKGNIHFFTCASGNCGFYTERNWQIDSGGGGAGVAEMEGW